jgi:hypothetical protein
LDRKKESLFIKCAFVFANLEHQIGPNEETNMGDEIFFEAHIEVNTIDFQVDIIKVTRTERPEPDFLFL